MYRPALRSGAIHDDSSDPKQEIAHRQKQISGHQGAPETESVGQRPGQNRKRVNHEARKSQEELLQARSKNVAAQ